MKLEEEDHPVMCITSKCVCDYSMLSSAGIRMLGCTIVATALLHCHFVSQAAARAVPQCLPHCVCPVIAQPSLPYLQRPLLREAREPALLQELPPSDPAFAPCCSVQGEQSLTYCKAQKGET